MVSSERETVRRELDVLLALLEAHYGKQPILYATERAYRLFLSEGYSDYDIWIRDVFSSRRFRTRKGLDFLAIYRPWSA